MDNIATHDFKNDFEYLKSFFFANWTYILGGLLVFVIIKKFLS